jgi:hypothetical protein
MSGKVEQLKRAHEKIREAESARDTLVKKLFPPGTVVAYSHGDNLIDVEIVNHGYGGSLKVRGIKSGKVYRIESYRIERV